MEQFTIPLAAFDVALLPEVARDVASPRFHEAVAEFSRGQIRELSANGVVTVTPERISVGWITPGFNPIGAAIAMLKRGQLREGAQLLELVRARHPDSPEVLYNLGVALSELGELSRAVEILNHLVEVEPGQVHGLVALGVALSRSKRDTAALEPLSKSVALAPDDAWAQKNLGGVLFRLGRGAEARGHLEAAVQLASQDAHAWLLLGDICLSLGVSDAGREALKRARTLDPHGPIRDLADAALNRMADSDLPRNADGVNPEALEAMITAVKHLRSMPPEAAQKLTLQAALIGQNGLRLKDPNPVHQLEGIRQPLTGLEVACLIHAGVQRSSPGTETGFPFEAEFAVARRHNGSDAR